MPYIGFDGTNDNVVLTLFPFAENLEDRGYFVRVA
jgi:hypothetical protein